MTGKGEIFAWTPQMDDAFIQAMLKEQDKGNRVDGTFTSQAYTNMVNELSKNFNKEFNKKYLKNRLKTLKDHFAQCYDIFRGVSLSGFAWNPKTKLFEAEEEVWEALILEKPKWKKKQISNYNELLELFAKDRAMGVASETTKERKNRMNNEQKVDTIDEIDQLLRMKDIILENFSSGDDTQPTFTTPQSQMKPLNANTSKSKKRKIEEEDAMIAMMMNGIESVATAITNNSVGKRSPACIFRGGNL